MQYDNADEKWKATAGSTRPRLITKSERHRFGDTRTCTPTPDGFTSVSYLRASSYTPFISPLCSTSFTATAMKSLLRKKSPTDDVKKPSPSSSTQVTRQPQAVDTPLYARFASTKPAAQRLEKNRLVVSGPMPLGRPSRANLEADSRRKHEEENLSRGRLSNGRRVLAGPESQPETREREFQSSLDRASQDASLDSRPSIKARTACKPHFPFPSCADVLLPSVMPSWMTCTH